MSIHSSNQILLETMSLFSNLVIKIIVHMLPPPHCTLDDQPIMPSCWTASHNNEQSVNKPVIFSPSETNFNHQKHLQSNKVQQHNYKETWYTSDSLHWVNSFQSRHIHFIICSMESTSRRLWSIKKTLQEWLEFPKQSDMP